MTNFSMSLRRRRAPHEGLAGSASGKRNSHLVRQVRAEVPRTLLRRGHLVPLAAVAHAVACNFRCSGVTPESALQSHFGTIAAGRTHVRRGFRPPRLTFTNTCSRTTANQPLGQRALDALRLTRSFLLLEDDYDVDWEVDREERRRGVHPHRVPLPGRVRRGGLGPRRPGEPARAAELCLCPVGSSAPAPNASARRSRPSERCPRRAPAARRARGTR